MSLEQHDKDHLCSFRRGVLKRTSERLSVRFTERSRDKIYPKLCLSLNGINQALLNRLSKTYASKASPRAIKTQRRVAKNQSSW